LVGLKATFVSLQRLPGQDETQALADLLGTPVHDASAYNDDLPAMLALLSLLDDYIGVSNTNMHLLGGLDKTARVLIPAPPDWRWLASGDESPWLPGFRVYRQQPDGDWGEALQRLAADLRESFGQ
jgi:hypothetical protein